MPRTSARLRSARLTAAGGVIALLTTSLIAVGAAPATAAPVTTTTNYSYTGSTASFVVPDGITALDLTVVGGLGGNGGADGPAPAVGSYRGVISGSVAVTPGSTITIAVGSGGTTGLSAVSGSAAAPAGGNNPLGEFSGGAGGRTGLKGTSGQGGAGGAATVVVIGSDEIVAAGGGGNGGSGQYASTRGRSADGTYVGRSDATSTNGQSGINAFDRCAELSCSNDDGGGSGGGGGGAQGGAQGQVEFGAGTSTEWFGYGGSVGQNSTAGRSGLAASYQYVAANETDGSVTISYVTGAPSAPSAVRGVAGISSVALEWNPPASPGGAAISDYEVQYSSDGGSTWSSSTLVGSDRTDTTVTGLTNGTAYVFRVAAVSAEGTGDFSPQSAPFTPYSAPSAPTLTALEAQDGALQAEFTAPETGAPVTGYEYRIDGGAWLPAAGTTSPLAIPGLTNGTTYEVELRATSSVGTGAASEPLSGTPAAVPGAPTIVSASATPQTISLDVTPGFDGGSAVLAYEYRVGSGSWVSTGDTSSPVVIGGLDDGTSYTVAVRAVNASGAGVPSEAVTVSTPGVPAAPTGVTLTPGDETLTVDYQLGDSNGSPIERVQYRVDGGTWTDAPNTGPFVISGLTNGTSYGVQLRATNALGDSAASPSVDGTPLGLASAPTITAVSATDPMTLAVEFTAPSSTGGSAITGYEYSTDSGVTWRAREDGGDTGSPIVLTTLSSDGSTPLDSGETYPIEIRAITAAGAGAASSVAEGIPVDAPSAPTISSVTPRSEAVAVTFTPGSNGGRAITAYEYNVDGGAWTSTGSLSTSFVVEDLTDGVPVAIRVRAVSSAGQGAASAPVSATPASAPEAPVVTSVVRSDRTLTADITPGSDGGAAVTAWQYSTDGGSTWATASGTSLPITITAPSADTGARLVNGQGYAVQVRAVNSAGVSPSSNTVTVTPASAPPSPTVTATAGNTSVSVSYALTGDGGSPLTQIEYSLDGDTWVDTGSLSTTFVLTGLTNGTPVDIQVRATNGIGTGAASPVASATPRTVPGAPLSVSAESNTGSLDVSWSAPTSDGGSAITGYTARVYTSATENTVAGSCTTDSTSCTVTGLTNETEYFVAVTATNVAGDGPESAPRETGTPLTRPSAPTISSVTAGDERLTVVFSAGDAGDRAISGYQYTIDGGATWTDLSGLSSPLVVSGLTNGTAYSVQLRAVSEAGPGAASNSGSGTPVGYPGVPDDITVTAANGSLVVAWSPADANGGVIESYTATAFNAAEAGSPVRTCTTGTTTCTLTGLANNTTYYVSVQALTEGGLYSERSNPRVAAVPGIVPGAPTSVTAVAGNASASVSWTQPSSVGTSSIVDYQILCSAAGGAFTECGTTSGASTSTTITGLTNGVSYEFRAVARNSSGPGASSTSSNAVTPVGPGVAPTFGTPTRAADGYSVEVTNLDEDATYTVTATSGVASISDGVVTVTGLSAGQSSTVTVTAARPDRSNASSSVSGTALAAGIEPELGTAVRTADGFTVEVENLDPTAEYTVDSSVGSAAIVDGIVTVTGLEPGQSATLTVTVSKSGSTTVDADVDGTALEAGVSPEFGEPTRTADGFTVAIDNVDAETAYTVSTTSGSAAVADGIVVVTGLEPGAAATVTVTAAKPGATTASADTSSRALASGAAPDLGTVTRTDGGFTVVIDDYDEDAEYSATSTSGTATVVDGVVVVTGLEAGESATVTVTVSRDGSTDAEESLTGTALETGVEPELGAPTRTVDGFTLRIENLDDEATYAVSTTAGTAAIFAGVVTVTGLQPGQSATVTVTASAAGATPAAASASEAALVMGAEPQFGPVTRTPDGFLVAITNLDDDASYTLTTTAGTAKLSAGAILVSGLAPDEAAAVTVSVVKAGSTPAEGVVRGAALEAGTPIKPGDVVRTATGFSFPLDDTDPGTTYSVSTTAGTATIVDGVVVVTGLRPGESAVVTVTGTKAGAVTTETTTSGTALAAGVRPILGEVTRTVTGFTVPITNFDPAVEYTVHSSAGVATLGAEPAERAAGTAAGSTLGAAADAPRRLAAVATLVGPNIVTVTGLRPGESAFLTVTASRTGTAAATAGTVGAALDPGVPAGIGDPTYAEGTITIPITDYDPNAEYTVSTSAGTVVRDGAFLVVTGLEPGEKAVVSVIVTRDGAAPIELSFVVVAPADTDSGGSASNPSAGSASDRGLAATGSDSAAVLWWSLLGLLTVAAGTGVAVLGWRRRREEEPMR